MQKDESIFAEPTCSVYKRKKETLRRNAVFLTERWERVYNHFISMNSVSVQMAAAKAGTC